MADAINVSGSVNLQTKIGQVYYKSYNILLDLCTVMSLITLISSCLYILGSVCCWERHKLQHSGMGHG
jgi:hypothetical protein